MTLHPAKQVVHASLNSLTQQVLGAQMELKLLKDEWEMRADELMDLEDWIDQQEEALATLKSKVKWEFNHNLHHINPELARKVDAAKARDAGGEEWKSNEEAR